MRATRGHILIEDVVKIYDPEGAAVMAVDHCSLEIEPGEICMIVGPSGCGKTTLLNAIAGFHEITSGRIVMDGEVLCSTQKPMSSPGPDRIVVFQNGALFPWKSNLENVIFGPVMQGRLARSEAIDKGRAMLADAGLSGVEAFSRVDRGDQRRRTRGSAEGVSGRREGRLMAMAARLATMAARRSFSRAVISILVFLVLWEIGARSKSWMSPEYFAPLKNLLGMMGFKKDYLPWIGAIPAPSAVLTAWLHVIGEKGYWQSWYMSFFRVMGGFIAA